MLVPVVFILKRHGRAAQSKRVAALMQAIAVFVFTSCAAIILATGLTDIYLVPALLAVAIAAYLLRKRMFPYRLTCPACGKRHDLFTADFKNIYIYDDNLCVDCRSKVPDEQE